MKRAPRHKIGYMPRVGDLIDGWKCISLSVDGHDGIEVLMVTFRYDDSKLCVLIPVKKNPSQACTREVVGMHIRQAALGFLPNQTWVGKITANQARSAVGLPHFSVV